MATYRICVDRKENLKCQLSHLDIQIQICEQTIQRGSESQESKSLKDQGLSLHDETENSKFTIEFN